VTHSPVVGVLSTWFGGTYFGGLLGGITAGVASRGGRLIAVQTLDAGTFSTDFPEAPPFRHRVAWEHIDGFIVFLNAANAGYLRAAQASGRPVVVISDDPAGVRCPAVRPDNRTGSRAAVEHLIGHGHRRIAFAGHLRQPDAAERYDQYRATLLANGLVPEPGLVFDTGDMQEAGGVRAARAMLAAGLPNRGHFRDRLTMAMTAARDRHEPGYAVLMMDLDGFKLVNDSLGHEAGDQLLQEVARRLTAQLRPGELAARLGGDEFAVLIEDLGSPQAPVTLAERLQDAVSAPFLLAGAEVTVTLSIGIALGAPEHADTQGVMRDADTAMYHAKSGGKKAHALFTPAMR
jgi:diguanylate cyclase (GGDEF)-like protein